MDDSQNFLFITFVLEQIEPQPKVRCRGCREIITPECDMPEYVKGLIELDDTYVPVIDPSIQLRGKPTRLTSSSCILVIKCSCEGKPLRTAVLSQGMEEVMCFVAESPEAGTVVDKRFIIDLAQCSSIIQISSFCAETVMDTNKSLMRFRNDQQCCKNA